MKEGISSAGRQAFPPVDHPRVIERDKTRRIQNISIFLFSPLSQQWQVSLPRNNGASMLCSARSGMRLGDVTTTISP